jgi:hypothetical protein
MVVKRAASLRPTVRPVMRMPRPVMTRLNGWVLRCWSDAMTLAAFELAEQDDAAGLGVADG